MYYTPVGGDIMFVEATPMPGKGELVLTGQLGDVMKESARAAWTYARAHADELYIDAGRLQTGRAHPRAGRRHPQGRPVGRRHHGHRPGLGPVQTPGAPRRGHDRRDHPLGRVLPIGGVKEKVLGAERAGITTVVLPKDNEADLEDLPEEIRDKLTFHLVEELGEALAHTLRGGEFREGRLQFTSSAPKKGSSPPNLQH